MPSRIFYLLFLLGLLAGAAVHASGDQPAEEEANGPTTRPHAEQLEPQGSSANRRSEPADRGIRFDPTPASRGNHWALIIGVNYTGRTDLTEPADRSVIPPLKNAVNDAQGIYDVLTQYYDYDPQRVIFLKEQEATKDAIDTALSKLFDPELVAPEDSLVVFFSGHGVRLTGQEGVAALPYDVQISSGRVTGKLLRLHQDLFQPLKERCPAMHKLVILDACYSGEIFNTSFQPRSETDPRSDERLQAQPSFQAMASCRATQVASDGVDGHSPFTAALIDGLKRIPAQNGADRVWANRLLSYMRSRFVMRDQQTPDCRSLVDSDGEFCFYPGDVQKFASYRLPASEQDLLRAMVSSRQGNWWFREMPWFIPSIREQIIIRLDKQQDRSRAPIAQFIEPTDLMKAAEAALKKKAAEAALNELDELGDIDRLRGDHFRRLLETHGTEKFDETLRHIAQQLEVHLADRLVSETPRGPSVARHRPVLEPVDIHLFALVQHALGHHEKAQRAYEQALRAYEKSAEEDEHRSMHRILQALCRADLAELLLGHLSHSRKAAEEFRKADQLIAELAADRGQEEAAAVFRVFTLCREADAWLRLNRWSEANRRLLMALDLSGEIGAEDYLAAHVHRRRAWAHMMQWEFDAAECSFRRSNDVLAATMNTGLGPVDPHADDDSHVSNRPQIELQAAACDRSTPFVIPDAVRQAEDFSSQLAFLHNLHGVAMTRRFNGDTAEATRCYRWLVGQVGDMLLRLQDTAADADVERQFLQRLINTKERLGDCNLFGDPKIRDVQEAADDYRRALAHVHPLRGKQRQDWQLVLLYKQALALSQPSPIQDTELALAMCRRADAIFAKHQETATGLHEALGRLATRIVTVIDSELRHNDHGRRAAQHGMQDTAVSELRDEILAFRDHIGQSPHRDQLELCLFASKVLLEHSRDQDSFQVLEDADLLLSFCRTALRQRRSANGMSPGNDRSPARAFLRPYYDAAMRARLGVGRSRVKEILEIHWEATQGTPYVKPEHPAPVLAVYYLDGVPILFLDLPSDKSCCVMLSEHCTVEALRDAVLGSSNELLPLPFEVQQLLTQWREAQPPHAYTELYCWLDDSWLATPWHVGFRAQDVQADPAGNGAERLTAVSTRFPFQLPDGFTLVTPQQVRAHTAPGDRDDTAVAHAPLQ